MAYIKRFADGFLIREAGPEDKIRVTSSFSIYDVLDYLPHMYDYYMTHPKYFCFLGEIHGKVVSIFIFSTDFIFY